MRKLFLYSFVVLCFVGSFLGNISDVYAQKMDAVYKMTQNNVTHKIHIKNTSGYYVIKFYETTNEHWSDAQLLVTDDENRYYKVKYQGSTYEIWVYEDGSLVCADANNYSRRWKYWADK